jgi:hypothetical protein
MDSDDFIWDLIDLIRRSDGDYEMDKSETTGRFG